jgi:hypothetical protein
MRGILEVIFPRNAHIPVTTVLVTGTNAVGYVVFRQQAGN